MEAMGWIDLVQDEDRWWVLMNMVMKALYDPAEGFGGETWGIETPWKIQI
jgi:hypothetical protein